MNKEASRDQDSRRGERRRNINTESRWAPPPLLSSLPPSVLPPTVKTLKQPPPPPSDQKWLTENKARRSRSDLMSPSPPLNHLPLFTAILILKKEKPAASGFIPHSLKGRVPHFQSLILAVRATVSKLFSCDLVGGGVVQLREEKKRIFSFCSGRIWHESACWDALLFYFPALTCINSSEEQQFYHSPSSERYILSSPPRRSSSVCIMQEVCPTSVNWHTWNEM